jgi:hypothetical protein
MCLQECWLHSLNLFAELQGSSADGVMRIYKDGCLIGENPGAMFGLATYFAEDFSKADLYAGPHCFKRCKGHCHVLVVARVVSACWWTMNSQQMLFSHPDMRATLVVCLQRHPAIHHEETYKPDLTLP